MSLEAMGVVHALLLLLLQSSSYRVQSLWVASLSKQYDADVYPSSSYYVTRLGSSGISNPIDRSLGIDKPIALV